MNNPAIKELTVRAHYLSLIFLIAAIPCFSQMDSTAMRADTTLANQYVDKAKTLAAKAQFDSSTSYYEKACQIYEQAAAQSADSSLWQKYLSSLTNIGVNHYRKGNYQQSLEQLQQALALGLEKFGEKHVAVVNIYSQLGIVHYYQGNYGKALDYQHQALATRLEIFGAEHPQVADSYNNLAIIAARKSDYPQTLDYFKKSLSIFLNAFGETHTLVACAYHNIGTTYQMMGDHQRALDYLQKSLAIDLKLSGEQNPDVGMTYGRIGILFGVIGDYDQAFEYFHKALSIYLHVLGENHPQVAGLYNDMGSIYQQQGDFQRALECFQKVIAIRLRTLGDHHSSLAIGYGNLGVIYRELGDYEKALEHHEKALSIHLQSLTENHAFVANTYRNMGVVHSLLGNDNQTIEHYEKAKAILKNLFGDKHPHVADMHQLLGEFYLNKNDFTQALAHSQQAIIALTPGFSDTNIYSNPPLQTLRLDYQSIVTLQLKANALRRRYFMSTLHLNDLKMSFITHRLMAELIDRVRISYQAEGSKLFLETKTARIYETAIEVALKLFEVTHDRSYLEAAFLFAEQAKAGVLSSYLQESRARRFVGLPDSLLEVERQLKIDLAFYETQLQKELQKKKQADSLLIDQLRARQFQANARHQRLIKQFERDYPAYYELKYQTEVASIAELQQALDPHAALVEYFVGDDAISIFTIDRHHFELTTVPSDSELVGLAELLFRSLKKADLASYVQSAHKVYLRIFKPIEHWLATKKRLIIIPDGMLYLIPFETLLANASKDQVDLTRLDYLINRFEISYHYSATLYLNGLTKTAFAQNRVAEKSFIGFAPVFSTTGRNGFILANQPLTLKMAAADDEVRTISADGTRIRELTYSKQELSGIIEQFKQRGKAAIGYFHGDASEANFKRQSCNYQLVHIATHGIINTDRPQLSAILFSQPQDSNAAEDGFFYASEAYNLDLQADLLVLSCCESGRGKLVRGEGVIALTRGFLYSGVSNIMVSLWKVSDKHTSQLMIDFYQNLLAGNRYAYALRQAKLNMIKNVATAFPKSWGGFVLVGK